MRLSRVSCVDPRRDTTERVTGPCVLLLALLNRKYCRYIRVCWLLASTKEFNWD